MASVKVVDGRPPLDVQDGVVVYIEKYASLEEFDATWRLWIIDYDGEPIDVLVNELSRLLPQFEVLRFGGITEAKTTELRTSKTEERPQVVEVKAPQQQVQESISFDEWEQRFEALRESIDDRMLLVNSGRPGKNGKPGKDGKDGRDGRDGKDLIATEVELEDLKNVNIDEAKKGQFLSYDGENWIAKDAPFSVRYGGGGAGSTGTGGGIPEAPEDGKYYVRQNGQWIDLSLIIAELIPALLDGGNFTTGVSNGNSSTVDAGNFSP